MTFVVGVIVTVSGHFVIKWLDRDATLRFDGYYQKKINDSTYRNLRFFENGEVLMVHTPKILKDSIWQRFSKTYPECGEGLFDLQEKKIKIKLFSHQIFDKWKETEAGKNFYKILITSEAMKEIHDKANTFEYTGEVNINKLSLTQIIDAGKKDIRDFQEYEFISFDD